MRTTLHPLTPVSLRPVELGRCRLRFAALHLVADHFSGGGHVHSHLLWRVQGRVVAVMVAGEA